ncbi:unnamed protein product [Prunus armeniaca]
MLITHSAMTYKKTDAYDVVVVGANFVPLEYSSKILSSSPLLFLPAKQIGIKGPHPGGVGQRPSDA